MERTSVVSATIEEVIADFRRGQMVIIVDDEQRENEGDLALAAEHVTPEAINFMATHGRGLICAPMTGEQLDELQIPLIEPAHAGRMPTAFTHPVDARHTTTTGISTADRASTIRALIAPDSRPKDFTRPGHVFPLRVHDGGVLVRPGQTEASVDLARLANLYPAAVICEIMNDDGTMARMTDLERFAAHHGLRILAIADLIAYLRDTDRCEERYTDTWLYRRNGLARRGQLT